MLHAVSLILLVVFMGGVLAESASAITLVDNFDLSLAPDLVVPTITDTVHVSQEFTTGTYAHGYEIENISLNLKSIHPSSDFSVSIHDVSSATTSTNEVFDVPGVKLYQLYGPTNSTGKVSFSASPGAVILLDANTKYFVVLSASADPNNAQPYLSNSTSESVSVDGWSIADEYVASIDGGNTWTSNAFTQFPVVISVVGSRVPNRVASGKPVIRGVVAVGESLFADVSGVRDLNGRPSFFSYQWVRVDGGAEEDIPGATLAIYNVVSADEGKLLKVKVSFIDGRGYAEGPLASDSTGVVLDAAPSFSHGTKLSGTLLITDPLNSSSITLKSIWSDGITLYGLNFYSVRRNIYAYTLSNGSRDRSKEFSNVGASRLDGIWSDGVTMWVADSGSDKLFAYRMSDKSRDSGKDFTILATVGNTNPGGIWSDGVTMWVADSVDDKIYAYKMSNKSRDSGKDFNTLAAAENEDPIGIWSDGVTMWVGDSGDAYVYAYKMSDKSRDSGKDLNVSSALTGFGLTGLGFDGRAMLIGSWDQVSFYAVDSVYTLPRWSEDSGKDCGGGVSTGCSVDVNGYGVGVVDPAADFDWWSLEFEGGKTYAIDVKGAGDQSGNDNAGTLPDPSVILYSHFGENPVLVDFSDNVDDGQNNNSRVVYSVGLDAGGTYYVSVAKASNSSEGGTYMVFVEDFNSLPVFSSGSSFSVDENVRIVGTVVASDPNIQDSVVGYRVSDGFDSALFEITSAGVLSFVSAPDYENPSDTGTDNIYVVVVEATSGAGGRVRTATQSITVTVNDVDEVPSTPSAPVLSSPSSTSLLVSWSAPSNTGPSIIDYDVGYGLNSGGPFVDWPHSGAGRSAVITGLNVSTLYYVRVLARNVEGSSGWSPTASFTTGSPPETNNPPIFTINSSFSVNENTFFVGTVVASDSDSQDNVTGYRVSGGADRVRLLVRNGNLLVFRFAPDYEFPVDSGGNNVYNLIITATSGTGDRVLTATQTITVTVVDVDEAPSRPDAPVLSSPSSTSLLVGWSAPGGTGPSIIDYDVGYGLNSGGPFVDWPHSGAGRSAVITGLSAGTLYYVRVLARNAEGNSSWSETASFTTVSVVVNSDPVFTSGSSFLVNENVLSVGVVVASDSDGQDGVSGYSVSGGVDRSLFSVTNGGVLTFVSAPDYESPADSGGNNVYDLVVTVTSGTGSRVRTATQSVTVTVVDVGEVPSNVTSVVALSQDFGNLSSVGNNDPRGIWSSGGVMYVVDSGDYRVYAYNLSTKDFILNQSFDLSSSDVPWGILV